MARARNHTTECGRTSCAASLEATLDRLSSGRRRWRLDRQGRDLRVGSHLYVVMIKGGLSDDVRQHAARRKALAGATGSGSALRHRSAIRHRIVARTVCRIIGCHFSGHCARFGHRDAGDRRDRHYQGDENSQNWFKSAHHDHSTSIVLSLLRAIAVTRLPVRFSARIG